MQTAIDRFLLKQDSTLHHGNIGLFTNQTSYHFASSKYLMEILHDRGVLSTVFIPEHGLFSELQDQEKLNKTSEYQSLCSDTKFVSLYTKNEKNLIPAMQDINKLDALVIDIQDAGSRYFTYLSSIYNILKQIHQSNTNTKVYIIDKVNPAGQKVEGCPLQKGFSSFIGIEGIPHRYGISIGELCIYFHSQIKADFPLEVIPLSELEFQTLIKIQPSPNFPSSTTAQMYTGTCLFEATTLSEGRGTTRPFEIIGAPFLSWKQIQETISYIKSIYPELFEYIHLRALKFIPTFHKHAGEICNGFQIHIVKKGFHALILGLILLHGIKNHCDFNIFLEGTYEYGSDKTALELLLGDKFLIKNILQELDLDGVTEYLKQEEKNWNSTVSSCRLYQ
jgi:uncharacterized protein YbbC (DUF1343 family)